MNTSAAGSGFDLRGVGHRVDDAHLLTDVDLTIEPNRFTVVVGRSGAGKSSLLRLLNRLDAPTTGTVTWAGTDLAATDVCTLRRRIGYVAQRPVVFDGTAADNLRVADPALTDRAAAELLARVGLSLRPGQEATTLSGGEAQRLCMARTLATEPEMILADEPTASLDGDATTQIEDLARSLADRAGVGWVWVSHDPDQTRRLADTVVVMDGGRVLASGSLDQLAGHRNREVRQAIGGP